MFCEVMHDPYWCHQLESGLSSSWESDKYQKANDISVLNGQSVIRHLEVPAVRTFIPLLQTKANYCMMDKAKICILIFMILLTPGKLTSLSSHTFHTKPGRTWRTLPMPEIYEGQTTSKRMRVRGQGCWNIYDIYKFNDLANCLVKAAWSQVQGGLLKWDGRLSSTNNAPHTDEDATCLTCETSLGFQPLPFVPLPHYSKALKVGTSSLNIIFIA